MNVQTLLVNYAKGTANEYLHNLSIDILKNMEKQIDTQLELNSKSNGGVVQAYTMRNIKRLIEVELFQRGIQ